VEFANTIKLLISKLFPALKPEDKSTGNRGEDEAAKYLLRNGFRIIVRNWRCPIGEVDIVCLHHKTIVFVEVKSSLKQGMISPEYRVGKAKQRKLRSLQRYYSKHAARVEECRFDVIAVWWEGGVPVIRHIENAF
jgi:putative endonuclease